MTVPSAHDLAGWSVVVAGAGRAGMSAARYLCAVGARVGVADNRFEVLPGPDPASPDRPGSPLAVEVQAFGARPLAMADALDLDGVDLVVASPGFAPTHPLMVAAADAAVPVWGEVELAWQVDHSGALGDPRTWLVVTGTNGKTTTTSMIADIVDAAGLVGAACGNIGLPVLDALQQTPRVEVLCVEMSSFQLHWAPSVAPDVGVVLNIADDHLDWHGSFEAYAQAKAKALRGAIAVVGLDDPVASSLSIPAASAGCPVSAGHPTDQPRRVGFTAGPPAVGDLGVIDGVLVDRAFLDPSAEPISLVAADLVHPPGPSGVADALAAAALALGAGIGPDAIRAGLESFRPAAHRGEVVAAVDGVAFVDDSKATNPHAAQAAISAHQRVVLIAGGLLKGASVDGMVHDTRTRLAGVIAIGRDRDLVVDAIARHAPEVPTVTVFTGDDGGVILQRTATTPEGERVTEEDVLIMISPDATPDPAIAVMDRAVEEAWRLARASRQPVDTVLLAPAAASLDMFASYGHRGDAFAAAAGRIATRGTAPADGDAGTGR